MKIIKKRVKIIGGVVAAHTKKKFVIMYTVILHVYCIAVGNLNTCCT